MSTVRVAPGKRERLVLVTLAQVDERARLLASRRLREKRWKDELRPDTGYSATMDQRLDALAEALDLEHAALFPKDTHRVSAEAAAKVLGDG